MIKNENLKKHLVSAATTFATMFILTLLVSIQDMSWTAIKGGALVGVLAAALRAGIKSLIPLITALANK